MGKVIMHPKAEDPTAIFPGVAGIDRRGAELALAMLLDLEDPETTDEDGLIAAERACLENWPRECNAFRNVVAEYLAKAKTDGPATEAGFCAVLTDYIALSCTGVTADAVRYERMYQLQLEEVTRD